MNVMNANNKFDKQQRLLCPPDYKNVFDNVTVKASSNSFLLLATNNSQQKSRIGIIVAKKHVRFAVQRNQTKRLIRETFRLQQDMPPLDMVILVRNKQDKHENAQIRQDLMVLWRRLKQQYAKKFSI